MWPEALAPADDLPLYGRHHVVALLLITACSTLLTVLARWTAAGRRAVIVRRAICWPLAVALATAAVAAEVRWVVNGTWSARENLPLHLCDIAAIVMIVVLVRAGFALDTPPGGGRVGAWQRLYELAYFWGIGGTVQALLTPDVGEPPGSPECVRYFVLHGGIVVGVLVLTLGFGCRPWPGAVRRVWVTTFLLALAMLPVDWAPDANYMYLCGPPENPTLYDTFGPWPWALIPLVLIGTLIFLVCYAPFWLADRRRASRPTRHPHPPAGGP